MAERIETTEERRDRLFSQLTDGQRELVTKATSVIYSQVAGRGLRGMSLPEIGASFAQQMLDNPELATVSLQALVDAQQHRSGGRPGGAAR